MKHLITIKILTEYPLWFSAFCLLLGLLYSFVLYRKEEKLKDTKPWLLKLMAASRFLLVSILAFLLLSPFVKTLFNKVEKPVIVIAQDNSASIKLNKDSVYYSKQYIQQLNDLKNKLEEDYEVKTYTFGNELNEGLDIDYNDKITNLSNVFSQITNKFYNRNVGALILASDGIFNQGANPIFSSGIEFPIYTIALGDTAVQKDVILKDVVFNKITFLGNQFPIEIGATINQCKGEKTKLVIAKDGKKLFEKELNIINNNFSITENVLLEANKVGVQHYRVSLSSVKDEISYTNNVKDIYIEVLDGRQNILLLADAPHPDLKAIKQSIENNQNYKVTQFITENFDGNIKPYSLVLLHQVNVSNTKVKQLVQSDVSLFYILGAKTNVSQFNQLNTGLSINGSRNRTSEILPNVNVNFPLFTLSESTVNYVNDMPPLIGSFGDYNLKGQAHILLNQKIGNVTTQNPLMLFFQQDNKKIGLLVGEGIWRWRMQDYLRNKTHNNFNEFINKTIQFLSVKEDKSRFRVITDNNYYENEEIVFNAELYNESYELVNQAEINIQIKDEKANEYNFVFSKTSTAYILNAGILSPGFYNYTSKVAFGTKNYTQIGKFQIKKLLLESNNTVANHQLMQNIAEKFGGILSFPKDLNNLENVIKSNDNITSIIYEENDIKELINLKWIFFILLLLLSLEWFLRKRNGAY